jgi:hypothetical protein
MAPTFLDFGGHRPTFNSDFVIGGVDRAEPNKRQIAGRSSVPDRLGGLASAPL